MGRLPAARRGWVGLSSPQPPASQACGLPWPWPGGSWAYVATVLCLRAWPYSPPPGGLPTAPCLRLGAGAEAAGGWAALPTPWAPQPQLSAPWLTAASTPAYVPQARAGGAASRSHEAAAVGLGHSGAAGYQ